MEKPHMEAVSARSNEAHDRRTQAKKSNLACPSEAGRAAAAKRPLTSSGSDGRRAGERIDAGRERSDAGFNLEAARTGEVPTYRKPKTTGIGQLPWGGRDPLRVSKGRPDLSRERRELNWAHEHELVLRHYPEGGKRLEQVQGRVEKTKGLGKGGRKTTEQACLYSLDSHSVKQRQYCLSKGSE